MDVIESRDVQENGGDDDSDCDNISVLSGLSDLSMESKWNSSAGMLAWVHHQIARGTDPRSVLSSLVPDDTEIPEDFDDRTIWQLIVSIVTEPPRRKKLANVNTLENVVHLLQTCKKIVVLTGAGVSVSCGIPDFRSRDGIYARLAVDYPDLPDPQAMFDIQYFKKNPRPFFKFAKEIYPGQFVPSVSHKFIGHLDSLNRLLRNYTQNIDTLESAAGITQVVQCHGSFASATCMVCKYRVDAEAIREDIMNQVIPRCPQCSPEEELAILKPDIVFFGESLSEEFHQQIQSDKDECDLLIVIGSSLKVRPVAVIPSILPPDVPQVLINRESLKHLNFDVELLGDCDIIINELCHLLGDSWKSLCTTDEASLQLTKEALFSPTSPSCQESVTDVPDASTALETSELHRPEDVRDGSKVEVDDATVAVGHDANSLTSLQSTTDHDQRKREKPHSVKITSHLKDHSFLYLPPRQYVFGGAEVYEDEDDSVSDSISSSSCSDETDDAESSLQEKTLDDSCVQSNCDSHKVKDELEKGDGQDALRVSDVDKSKDDLEQQTL